MKGIGKLLELLNEYDSGWDYDDYYGPYQYGQDTDAYKYGKYYLVSHDYGFIKWLVENDKINVEKVYNNSDYPMVKRDEFLYEGLLMLLSIQDDSVEFLVSVLK